MSFLQWNSGTLGVLPNVRGVTRTPIAAPTLITMWGSFTQTFENPFWTSYINGIVCTWLDNIYLVRIFNGTVYGRLNKRDAANAVADYGNVLDDVLDPWTFLNTFRASVTFGGTTFAGQNIGLAITQRNDEPAVAPPNPPLPAPLAASAPLTGTVVAGGELQIDIAIDAHEDHSSILFKVCQMWDVMPAGRPATWEMIDKQLCFTIVGQRAVMINFEPDWKESPPRVRFLYPDDLFESDDLEEQRTTALPAGDMGVPGQTFCIRRISAQFKTDGKADSTELWLRLCKILHRKCAVPHWVEPLQVAVDPSGSAVITVVNFPLAALMLESAEIVLFDRRDRTYETRRVTNVNRVANTVTVAAAWSKSIPPHHAVFYMVLFCQIEGQPKRRWASDLMQVLDVVWRTL